MASNRHSPAVEEGELPGSQPTPQPIFPAPATQPLNPVSRPPPMIPAPAPQPTPPTQPLAGHIQRVFPPAPVRKPFLWCIAEKILGQGAFGTVFLVHQTRDQELCGARKVGAIPLSFKIPDAPHAHKRIFFSSLSIWKE